MLALLVWLWEGLVMANGRGAGRQASGAIQDTWVIDVSVGCVLGARTVLSALSLVTADDCLLAGRLGVPSLPVLAFR